MVVCPLPSIWLPRHFVSVAASSPFICSFLRRNGTRLGRGEPVTSSCCLLRTKEEEQEKWGDQVANSMKLCCISRAAWAWGNCYLSLKDYLPVSCSKKFIGFWTSHFVNFTAFQFVAWLFSLKPKHLGTWKFHGLSPPICAFPYTWVIWGINQEQGILV